MIKKEFKSTLKLKLNSDSKWDIYLQNRPEIINNCLQLVKDEGDFTEAEIEITFKKKGKKKAPNKLGYFYAEILPKITYGLKENGWWEMTDEIAYLYLCKRFLGVKKNTNSKTSEVIEEIIRLSEVDDTEMRKFMDSCIKFASIDLKVYISTPDEYKCSKENFR